MGAVVSEQFLELSIIAYVIVLHYYARNMLPTFLLVILLHVICLDSR